MKKKVAVVTNPKAGKNTARAGLGKTIASILTTPRRTYSPETLAALEATARRLNHDRPDILVIVGGDGTVHQTLTKLLREREGSPEISLPQLLVIPVGTMNNIASDIGLTRHPAVELAEIVAAKIRENVPLEVVHRTPLKIKGEFGFIYGSGLPVNFLQKYYEDKKHRGPTRAAKVILATFGNELTSLLARRESRQILTRPVHAKIALPGRAEAQPDQFMAHTGILCSSIEHVGLGCRAMPLATERPGHFMLRTTQLSFWGLTASATALWAGHSIPATFDAVVSRVAIDYQEPTVATVDGDMKAPTTSDVVDCGPSMSFIVV